MMVRILLSRCAAIAMVAGLAAGSLARASSIEVGQPAPDFRATTLDGHEFSLADFKGQVLVLNFWATWCVPCKAELPLLEGYYRAQSKNGLRVLAVSTEGSLPAARLQPIADKLSLSMALRFSGSYGAIKRMVPTNYVIDRSGVVRYAQPDAFTLDTLNAVLIPLLNEKPASVATPAPDMSAK
jgi:cytochrome c biogenesis protein CcmG, thiol:disulfide interchange protein DsbE